MPGRTKIYDQAQQAVGDLRREMRKEFLANDGVIDEREERLLGMADEACELVKAVRTLIAWVLRIFGGGKIDRGLLADIRDAERLKPIGGEPTGFEVEIEKEAA
jgi:hypothetical protein